MNKLRPPVRPLSPRRRVLIGIATVLFCAVFILWLLNTLTYFEFKIMVITLFGGAVVIYLLFDEPAPPR